MAGIDPTETPFAKEELRERVYLALRDAKIFYDLDDIEFTAFVDAVGREDVPNAYDLNDEALTKLYRKLASQVKKREMSHAPG
ncbi:MAG: hypothetical protein ACR2RF_33160 [Geminicoccaceae bacterium]